MEPRIQDFRLHLRRALYVPLLMALVLGGTFAVETYLFSSYAAAVERSHDLLNNARQILRVALDMETGLRGYLLTGSSTFLEPYRDAEGQIDPAFARLRELAGNDGDLKMKVDTLQAHFTSWREYSASMIEARRTGGSYDTVDANLRGKELMDQVRRDRDAIIDTEEAVLNSRLARVRMLTRTTVATAFGLSVLLGFLLATFARRELRHINRSFLHSQALADHRTRDLEANERWLAAVLGSIGDGVIATDDSGGVAFMNDVALQIAGLDRSEAVGKPLDEVLQVVNEYSRQPLHEFPAAGAAPRDGDRSAAPQTQEGLVLRSDGSEIPVTLSRFPLRDKNSRGVVLVIRDLTEQRKSEATLRSTEKLANMGRIAAVVAHEIHNPLDAIANLLYLLDNSTKLDEVSKQHLRLANEELDRVTQISQQMLNFNRESRQPVPVRVRDLIDNVLVLYQGRIVASSIEVKKKYEQILEVRAFPGELRQVFSTWSVMRSMPWANPVRLSSMCARRMTGAIEPA